MQLTNIEYLQYILDSLAQPMPYSLRLGSKMGDNISVLGYIDARVVMDRLDEVCTYGWSKEINPVVAGSDVLWVCRLSINMPDGSVLYRDDIGENENKNEGIQKKGAASDALKRAAVNFGIGRFLYDLPKMKVNYEEKASGKYTKVIALAPKDSGVFKKGQDITYSLEKYFSKEYPDLTKSAKIFTYNNFLNVISESLEKRKELYEKHIKDKMYVSKVLQNKLLS